MYHEFIIGVETGGAPGACAPKFHKLLYKLLTTQCVVSDCAPPPPKSKSVSYAPVHGIHTVSSQPLL